MKSFAGLLLLFVWPLVTDGQENPFYLPKRIPNRDSLQSIVRNTNDEQKRLEAYRELGFSYYENKRDSALYYFEECVVLANRFRSEIPKCSDR